MSESLIRQSARRLNRRAAALGRSSVDGPDDAIESDHPSDTEMVLPVAIWIDYRASAGESRRSVILKRIWRDHGVIYFQGICQLRHALRKFRADRVVELVCLATGEVVSSPSKWLLEQALFEGDVSDDGTTFALRTCRDELALLVLMARADGKFDEAEIEVAISHLALSNGGAVDRVRARRYIERLTPSYWELEATIGRVLRHQGRWAALVNSMRRMVDADGEIDSEEVGLWEEMETIERRLEAADVADFSAIEDRTAAVIRARAEGAAYGD